MNKIWDKFPTLSPPIKVGGTPHGDRNAFLIEQGKKYGTNRKLLWYIWFNVKYIPLIVPVLYLGWWMDHWEMEEKSKFRGKSKMYGPFTDPNIKPWP